MLIAQTGDRRYLRAVDADRIEGLDRIPDLSSRQPRPVPNYQAIVEIKLAAGAGPVTRDLQLVPARTVTGTIIDPDGKPVVEAVAMGLDTNVPWADQVLASAEFTVKASTPECRAASTSSRSIAGSPGRC